MQDRFRTSDFRFLAVCAVLLVGATWFSARNFYRAFPEASIDFRVSRGEGEAMAARFLAGEGYVLGGYRQASSFNFDNNAKTFLERELGLEKANRVMGARVRLWRWSYRWFRPLQKEEFRADLTPAGELAGFAHELPEDAARPAVAEAEARARAEAFLRGTKHHRAGTFRLGRSLAGFGGASGTRLWQCCCSPCRGARRSFPEPALTRSGRAIPH